MKGGGSDGGGREWGRVRGEGGSDRGQRQGGSRGGG